MLLTQTALTEFTIPIALKREPLKLFLRINIYLGVGTLDVENT